MTSRKTGACDLDTAPSGKSWRDGICLIKDLDDEPTLQTLKAMMDGATPAQLDRLMSRLSKDTLKLMEKHATAARERMYGDEKEPTAVPDKISCPLCKEQMSNDVNSEAGITCQHFDCGGQIMIGDRYFKCSCDPVKSRRCQQCWAFDFVPEPAKVEGWAERAVALVLRKHGKEAITVGMLCGEVRNEKPDMYEPHFLTFTRKASSNWGVKRKVMTLERQECLQFADSFAPPNPDPHRIHCRMGYTFMKLQTNIKNRPDVDS